MGEVTQIEFSALLQSTHDNGVALHNIDLYVQVFLVLIGIFIAYKGAMYIYKGLIMQTIRSYIKFKF